MRDVFCNVFIGGNFCVIKQSFKVNGPPFQRQLHVFDVSCTFAY